MRRRFAAAVCALLPLAASAQEPTKLHIHFADGTTTAYWSYGYRAYGQSVRPVRQNKSCILRERITNERHEK